MDSFGCCIEITDETVDASPSCELVEQVPPLSFSNYEVNSSNNCNGYTEL